MIPIFLTTPLRALVLIASGKRKREGENLAINVSSDLHFFPDKCRLNRALLDARALGEQYTNGGGKLFAQNKGVCKV